MTAWDSALDYSGKTVLVVGGSSGIGNGIAQTMRQCGATVHVWGRKADAADYIAQHGSDLEGIHYRQVDITDFAGLKALEPEFACLDVLILSQGAVLYRRQEYEMEGFEAVISVNLTSVMACATKFQPMLARTKGAVIVISSTGAYRATKGNPAYSASKAGTLGLVRTLAEAWAPEGIRVNGIAPGMIATKMTSVTTDNPDRLAAMLAEIPAGRLGSTDDIAGAAVFLASPLASYVVGQMLVVDGGSLLS